MSTRMTLLITLSLGLSSTLITAAQPPSPNPSNPPVPLNPQDVLNKCINALEKLPAYEVQFSQWSKSPGLPIELKARCIHAPNRKVRYEADTHQGSVHVQSKIICDGTTVWRISKAGGLTQAESYRITDMDTELKQVELGKTNLDVDKAKQLRFDIETEHGFHGLLPTIQDLVKHMQFKDLQVQMITLNDGRKVDAYVLTGTWNKDVLDVLAPTKKPGEDNKTPDEREQWDRKQSYPFFPRECRLFLLQQSLYPVKAEWWGPDRFEGYLVPLARWEWNDIKALTPQAAQQAFQLTDDEKKLPFTELNYSQLLKQRIELMSRRQLEMSRYRKLDVAPDRGPAKSP